MRQSREGRISVTYYVVVPFDRTAEGDLRPGAAEELPSAGAAERRARAVAGKHVGAVAFARSGDPATGEFSEPTILASVGEVELSALSE